MATYFLVKNGFGYAAATGSIRPTQRISCPSRPTRGFSPKVRYRELAQLRRTGRGSFFCLRRANTFASKIREQDLGPRCQEAEIPHRILIPIHDVRYQQFDKLLICMQDGGQAIVPCIFGQILHLSTVAPCQTMLRNWRLTNITADVTDHELLGHRPANINVPVSLTSFSRMFRTSALSDFSTPPYNSLIEKRQHGESPCEH